MKNLTRYTAAGLRLDAAVIAMEAAWKACQGNLKDEEKLTRYVRALRR
jgi:hypothetical protein